MVIKVKETTGYCKVSVASVYKKPSTDAMLVTQVLFGECVYFISKKNKHWFKIKCAWDDMVGWVDAKQFEFYTELDKSKFESCHSFSLELIHGLMSEQKTIPITIGSNLINCDGLNVKLPFGKFQYSGQIINLNQSNNLQTLIKKIGLKYLHSPYFRGGRSPLGIDASALVQLVYKMIGLALPRTAQMQSEVGEDIGFTAFSEVGDLAFFADKHNQIIHVGLVVEPMKILHCHGYVKVDQLDDQGIFDLETRKYTYKLRTIRRVLNLQNEKQENFQI